MINIYSVKKLLLLHHYKHQFQVLPHFHFITHLRKSRNPVVLVILSLFFLFLELFLLFIVFSWEEFLEFSGRSAGQKDGHYWEEN
jgi:hypothetical protein